ncbi:hypothetical protein HYV22_01760, partial [Candidatus Gottesmanbacteria bacterium]|nr:hypothetical protein [Candidatus Gottesmanbacteria bacterium]
DSGSSAVYFAPFVANAPQGKPSYTTGSLPSFSFSINSWRFEDLVKDLDSFRIAINKDNQGWVPYIENIPVSYEKVRESGDNKRRSIVPSNGNGVYENKTKIVTYTSNNGTIEVQAKAVNRQTGESTDKDWDNGGFLLPKGSYLWRVEAVDRSGHTQATGERTLFVGGSRQIITSRSWFPLTIDSFTGVGNSLDWSSVHPQDIPATITSSSQTPTITGIAVAGSFVTATIDGTSSVSTTTEENSRYTLTLSPLLSGNDYSLTLSVSDTGGNYNALPEVQLLSEE